MNFLKKKLKPFTTGLTTNTTSNSNKNKDLEDDLYDDYVVEAPPHPSELIALGVDPSEIDANDPDKLRELYKKVKEKGKDKQVNSILLAKQREKEEIEAKKKTREEWKYFDSLTSRLDQVVQDSRKSLNQLKELSAIDKLNQDEIELPPSAYLEFKAPTPVRKVENKSDQNNSKEGSSNNKKAAEDDKITPQEVDSESEFDEFGCPIRKLSIVEPVLTETANHIAEELLEDFGIDLRSAEQKRALEEKQKVQELERARERSKVEVPLAPEKSKIAIKARPRPKPGAQQEITNQTEIKEEDPFDTSFVPSIGDDLLKETTEETRTVPESPKIFDPFDTSYIKI